MKFGFVKDEDYFELNKVFKNNAKLKEIHIDIYPENPLSSSIAFMLLLRTSNKNVKVLNNNDRLILLKNDEINTHIINIATSNILECFYINNENYTEFILNIQNIYYKITIFN